MPPPPSPRIAVAGLAGFAAFAFMLIVPTALRDGDTGWHLATGAWVLAHGRVPTSDPFSFSAYGRPWVAHEWLSDVVMYAAYRLGGWSGLIVPFGLAMGALYAILAFHMQRWMRPRAVVLALIVVTAGLLPSLLARPHLLALPVLALWLVALLAARARNTAPPLPLAALMLVWANMHGSFVFGLALAGVFAFEALVTAPPSARRAVILGWGAFGLLALLAALCTPSGIHGLLFPFYVDRLALLAFLDEWQPADFHGPSLFEFVLLAGLAFLLARPAKIPPIRLILMLGVLHLALEHSRQLIVLVVVGAIVLAEPLGRAWNRERRSATPAPKALPAAIVVLAIVLTGYRLAVLIVRPDSASVPATAIRALPPELKRQRVFNNYGFGGPLILAGVRPFIDGRSDMYGDPFTLDYFRIAGGDMARFDAADRRWRFGWTMLPPSSPLVRQLDRRPEWRRAYADDFAVIHVRR